jgi:mediator of RNA polymerase II transcription subunit 23
MIIFTLCNAYFKTKNIDTDRISPLVFKVIERIGPKGLSGHLRKFCDYIICEFGARKKTASFNNKSNKFYF